MSALDYLSSRILTHYRAIKEEFAPPRMMILYPTYACNGRCGYCEYKEDIGTYTMPWEMLEEVIRDAAAFGVESVELCGGGEPTMHPDFLLLCQLIVNSGMKLGVLTNGWGLAHTEDVAPFLAANASYVRVSLDAASHSTYKKVKGIDTFSIITEAIRWLTAMKADSCKISAKFLLTPDNYTEVVSMARLARGLGLDSAQFKEVRSTQGLSHQQHEIAKGLLELARSEVQGIRIIGDLSHPTMKEKCRLCKLHTIVDADGSVYLCCYFRHRKDSHCIGNVYEGPLPYIWGGLRHREAMENIVPEECNLFDCRFVEYHRIVDELIWKGAGQFEFL